MADLLNCPFCGWKAEGPQKFASAEWEGARSIVCTNPDCKLFFYHSSRFETREQTDANLVARWNRRTQSEGAIRMEGVDTISLETLRWWRQLVDANPQDLAPRLDAAIERASLLQPPAGSTGEGPPTVSEPTEPGAFKGDIWFGHPVKRNMGTHRWNGESWEVLQDETDGLLVLLAKAREEIALLKAAASTPAQSGLVAERVPEILDRVTKAHQAVFDDRKNAAEDYLMDAIQMLSALSRAPSQPAPMAVESVNSKLLREATLLLQNVEDGFPMNTVEFPPWLRDCRKRIEAIAASPQPDRESERISMPRKVSHQMAVAIVAALDAGEPEKFAGQAPEKALQPIWDAAVKAVETQS